MRGQLNCCQQPPHAALVVIPKLHTCIKQDKYQDRVEFTAKPSRVLSGGSLAMAGPDVYKTGTMCGTLEHASRNKIQSRSQTRVNAGLSTSPVMPALLFCSVPFITQIIYYVSEPTPSRARSALLTIQSWSIDSTIAQ